MNGVPVPGTAIGDAIERAMESFDFKDPTTKVLVIMTDGENTEGDDVDAAQEAAKKGMLIYTIGLGSPTGAPIPVYNSCRATGRISSGTSAGTSSSPSSTKPGWSRSPKSATGNISAGQTPRTSSTKSTRTSTRFRSGSSA